MSELTWGVLAIVILLFLTLLAMGMRTVTMNKMSLGVANLFEDGLLFGVFAILFAPLYLTWMGAHSIWSRLSPAATLPLDGDDLVWGRKVNRQVVETVVLAIHEARVKHNASRVKKLMVSDLYEPLRRECEHARAKQETEKEETIEIENIVLSDERIDKQDGLCYFNATVTGTITSEGGTAAVDFTKELEFIRAPSGIKDARWELNKISRL